MSKIKNGGLDQYGAEPFERQQFGPADVEGVKSHASVHPMAVKCVSRNRLITHETIKHVVFFSGFCL